MIQKDTLNVQTNLRATHFTLGNNPDNPYKTVNRDSYKPVSSENIESQGEKLALRNSHFILGDYNKPGFYNTMHNIHYPYHKGAQGAKLEEEKRRDLRTHHFQLGSYGPTIKTSNNLVYNQKPLQKDLQHERDAQKAKMRAHHHNFAESTNIVMTTHYNDQYNKDVDPQALKQGIPAAELKQKVVDLRNSHIILGKEYLPMVTTQQNDYSQKPEAKREAVNPLLQQSHFQLGNSGPDFKTTNNQFHDRQPLVENKLAEETKKDLRASHFTMGQDQQGYLTETKGNYINHHQQGFQKVNQDEKFFKNNFTHTNPNGNNYYNSTYKTFMKAPQISNVQQSRNQQQDRGSNFKIGFQGDSWQTEFQDKFNQKEGGRQIMNQQLKNNLRSSHFQFNDVKNGLYNTTFKSSFTYKDGSNARGTLDQQLQKDLRSHHFHFGNQQGEYQTTNQRTYTVPKNAERAQFNKEKAADLRADHFKIN
ncbi:hypothetical protein ABPG72_002393 [Tetrahymena utriculariae]